MLLMLKQPQVMFPVLSIDKTSLDPCSSNVFGRPLCKRGRMMAECIALRFGTLTSNSSASSLPAQSQDGLGCNICREVNVSLT